MKKFLKGECFECNDKKHLELVDNCTRIHGKKTLNDVNRYKLYELELGFFTAAIDQISRKLCNY